MDAYRQVISDNQWGSEGISLFFSSPPGEARLVAIDRRLDNTPNPLTSQQFREALVAKYGTPASDDGQAMRWRSEEHTSELQSLMRISYAVFCLKKKTANNKRKHS